MPESSYSHILAKSHDNILLLEIIPKQLTEYEIAQNLGREMVAAIEDVNPSHVVIDMHNLSMMSSVGYGPFVDIRVRLKNASDGRVFLCEMSDVIQEVFTAARLLINPRSTKSRFESADTVEDAIRILANGD